MENKTRKCDYGCGLSIIHGWCWRMGFCRHLHTVLGTSYRGQFSPQLKRSFQLLDCIYVNITAAWIYDHTFFESDIFLNWTRSRSIGEQPSGFTAVVWAITPGPLSVKVNINGYRALSCFLKHWRTLKCEGCSLVGFHIYSWIIALTIRYLIG